MFFAARLNDHLNRGFLSNRDYIANAVDLSALFCNSTTNEKKKFIASTFQTLSFRVQLHRKSVRSLINSQQQQVHLSV